RFEDGLIRPGDLVGHGVGQEGDVGVHEQEIGPAGVHAPDRVERAVVLRTAGAEHRRPRTGRALRIAVPGIAVERGGRNHGRVVVVVGALVPPAPVEVGTRGALADHRGVAAAVLHVADADAARVGVRGGVAVGAGDVGVAVGIRVVGGDRGVVA